MKFWKMAQAEMLVLAFLVFSTNTNGRSSYITWLWERDKLKFCPPGKAKKEIPSLMAFLPTAKSKTLFGCLHGSHTYLFKYKIQGLLRIFQVFEKVVC